MKTIHEIINARSFVQECDNVIREIQGIKKPHSEAERIHYNLVTLYYFGIAAFVAETNEPEHYCPDCSFDARRPIYHKDRNQFLEFKHTYSVMLLS